MTIGTPTYFPAGPIAIRDGAVALLTAMPGLKTVFAFRTLPTKPEHLPAACVYHAGDRTKPMGDANVGVPSFEHTLSLVVDVITAAPTEASLDSTVVPLVEAVKAALLTDPRWVNLIEACERVDTRYSYPKEGETFLCVGTVEFEVTFSSEWAPVAENDLREIAFTVGSDPRTSFRQSVTFGAAS